uniref:Uncharacterized protein n=1 Tax=Myotis myotis TaxID=51298 RepID=A0A7J7ZY10_MYOMY|nr:hypothetical protein mMyoMyo1_009972 [Myotis myotis]
MAHLLNLKINTESSFFGFSMAHLLNLSSVLSTFLPYLSSIGGSAVPWWSPIRPVWGSHGEAGGLPRGILFQGFPKVWTESAETIHPLPMVESYPSREWGLPRGPCSGARCRGPTPAGPGVPKGVDGVGEEGMIRRQCSVDQQPIQDLQPGSPAKFCVHVVLLGSPARFCPGSPARFSYQVLFRFSCQFL